MKGAIFLIPLLGVVVLASPRGNAGSAEAIGVHPHGHLAVVSNPSYSEETAKQKVLALWHPKWSGEARILASTGVVGECAVATVTQLHNTMPDSEQHKRWASWFRWLWHREEDPDRASYYQRESQYHESQSQVESARQPPSSSAHCLIWGSSRMI